MNVPVHHFLYLGAFLFSAGLVVVISKRNTILVLLGLELMLNASNLNLVAFNRLHPGTLQGQMFAIFVIVVAVCEAAVGLAIVLRIYQEYQTSVPDDVNELNL
ncbi:NADH-quinone oxidoreductase subunit NuoK [Chryseolinea soli]|uniref:NADH-quinone oxidoreductase subunit K n=1 Tax=Chryseolinea soli TaxID=2321403 RepID=A0A385SI51_9BACT|nr:NADH-quinone oxidoreductase subunit NuoK [Chryseolinea soli]AYB31413.1 NADH-quinone oxidoreductase subunit NuoK [Chryseolinea soli]